MVEAARHAAHLPAEPQEEPRAPVQTQPCPTCGRRYKFSYRVCPHDGTPLGTAGTRQDPLIGETVGGAYRINRLIAQGGMGKLYEAEHSRLPRRYAVKVIHDHYAQHPDAVRRFEREARAAASIASPHVVSVIDITRTSRDQPCMVTEYLDGEDLQQRLERLGRLPVEQVADIARQLCAGITAAHRCGVIHRDLKPSNIFLTATADGNTLVKVLDFGVAKLSDSPEITKGGAVVGTPAYMAPEQACGAKDVGPSADVYGIGAVMYRMLTGRSPYESRDATSSLAMLVKSPPEPLHRLAPHTPLWLRKVVETAMARKVEDRPSSPRVLLDGLVGKGPSITAAPHRRRTRISVTQGIHPSTLVISTDDTLSPTMTPGRGWIARRSTRVVTWTVAVAMGATGMLWTQAALTPWTGAWNGPLVPVAGMVSLLWSAPWLWASFVPPQRAQNYVDKSLPHLLHSLLAAMCVFGLVSFVQGLPVFASPLNVHPYGVSLLTFFWALGKGTVNRMVGSTRPRKPQETRRKKPTPSSRATGKNTKL